MAKRKIKEEVTEESTQKKVKVEKEETKPEVKDKLLTVAMMYMKLREKSFDFINKENELKFYNPEAKKGELCDVFKLFKDHQDLKPSVSQVA
jgi:hypothetical protein